jgi:hypothetical protein
MVTRGGLTGAAVVGAALLLNVGAFAETREIYLGARSPDGRFVLELGPQNFVVKNAPVRVRSVTLDSRPRRVALLIDASGSMRRSPHRWSDVGVFLHALLAALPGRSSFSLHIFAERHQVVVSATNSPEPILRGFESIPVPASPDDRNSPVGNGTRMDQAFGPVLDAQPSVVGPLDCVVLFTDEGEPNWNPRQAEKILARLGRMPLRLFHVQFAQSTWSATNPLQSLARDSGGALIELWLGRADPRGDIKAINDSMRGLNVGPDRQELTAPIQPSVAKEAAGSLSSLITYLYRVELEVPDAWKQKKPLEFEVVDDAGKVVKVCTPMCPRVLLPPPPTAPVVR